jgi:dienelactone hydrolase
MLIFLPNRIIRLSFLGAFIGVQSFAQTNVLSEADKPAQMMETYLRAKTVEVFDRRAEAYEKIKTPEDCAAHQQRIRDFFVQQLGGWPEKTPLNAHIVDTLDRGAYHIEKLIYESRPQFYVTALMYLPKSKPPYPAVLFPCGHEANGKAGESYQRACAFLATNGIAALCYDPIGQAERAQLLDENGKQKYTSTIEHTLVAVSCIPLGTNVAAFRIWDGIRGIDYLQSRPDIIKDKIGCTGNSGGGTLTTYISALDDRVFCAAPSCYITSLKDLILKDGPHDGEQCIAGQLAFGMDQGDYLMARAPRPTMVLCATRDFFPIAGTWDTYRSVKRFYTRLGYPERLEISEADEEHGYTPLLRQAMVRWMKRWLLNVDDTATEPDVTPLTDAEAQVTQEGQVLKIAGARSVWDINNDLADQLAEQRKAQRNGESKEDLLKNVRDITRIRPLSELPALEAQTIATAQQSGYRVENLVLRPEPGLPMPAILYVPSGEVKKTVLYVAQDGKSSAAAQCEALAKEGAVVLAVDLPNCGETKSSWSHGEQWEEFFGPSYKAVMLAYQLDRPFVTMWAENILVCARYLKQRPESKGSPVQLIAAGSTGPAALHAAALDTDNAIASLQLDHAPESWDAVVRTPDGKGQFITTVHGALRTYDLGDLRAVVASRIR